MYLALLFYSFVFFKSSCILHFIPLCIKVRERNYHFSLIADRRHLLFGHICRLLENTPASQALQLSIEVHTSTPPAADWKRPPGRPRRNWLQQVEEDIGLYVGAAWIAG